MKSLSLCVYLLSGLAVVCCSFESGTTCPNESAEDIQFSELKEGLDNGSIILVDVREKVELQEHGAIPKSYNIPLAELETDFKLSPVAFIRKHGFRKPPAPAANLVISCKAGIRAHDGWKTLNQFGYCSARVYYGSFDDWLANNGEVKTV